MDKEQRQLKVLEQIKLAKKPISASKLAKLFGVSRQLIVGDIALLRASGEKIFATPRGYLIEQDQPQGIYVQIACKHDATKMADELNIIVDEGAKIIDVIIEHPIYGELKGNLHLSTRREVKQFIESTKKFNAPLLSNLSHGVHLHTLKIKDQDTLKRIEEALIKENILYTKEDELKEGDSYE